jgi:tRNA modification GTPase
MINNNDTIVAVATGRGGAIAVVRVSGGDAVAIADRVFAARSGRRLSGVAGYTVHFGEIRDAAEVVDEVLVTVFRAPHSYTGEDSVEISCHASPYIEARIVQLLIAGGARAAGPGEFTVRAFLAGKLDLAQAEAVADLIASSGRASHSLAMGQLRGGVSSALTALREELVSLAALLELELDFSEEDVEFASRDGLRALATRITGELDTLAGSFTLGNAIRQGVPVAIVGAPNAGKSTLLNALVGDDRAMTSEIAGTTRDRIEERVNIGGVGFRFIDTAGLRPTDDVLEQMGIDRAMEAVAGAYIVLLVVDAACVSADDLAAQIASLGLLPDQRLCVVVNKIDKISDSRRSVSEILPPSQNASTAYGDSRRSVGELLPSVLTDGPEAFTPSGFSPTVIAISARTGERLDELREWLSGAVDVSALEAGAAVVSGARHYEALVRAREAMGRVSEGLSTGLSADLLAEDLREALHHLGQITGTVTSDDILGTIFSKFCIGK